MGKVCGNNTAKFTENGITHYILHETCIVKLDENGRFLLNTGGWNTSTTVRRMNQIMDAEGINGKVQTVKGKLILTVTSISSKEEKHEFDAKGICNPYKWGI